MICRCCKARVLNFSEMMSGVVYFFCLLCGTCSVCSAVVIEVGCAKDIVVQESDRCLYAGKAHSGAFEKYQNGAVWVRSRVLYCRPENACEFPCVYYDIGVHRGGGVSALCNVSRLVEEFVDSEDTSFADFSSRVYPLAPYKDILAAVVPVIKWVLLDEILSVCGVLHPDFDSWACCAQNVRYSSDRIIKCTGLDGGCYGRGSIWIRKNLYDRILCYRPYFGPEWMQYSYQLRSNTQQSFLPLPWSDQMQVVRDFALAQEKSFAVFAGNQYSAVVAMIPAVLPGRAASWDEPHTFTWAPECRDDDPFLKAHEGDKLLSGQINSQGFYVQKSKWLTKNQGEYVIRFYTPEVLLQGRNVTLEDEDKETLGLCQRIALKLKSLFS